MILYLVSFSRGHYLHSLSPHRDATGGIPIYFRDGSDTLFTNTPTFYPRAQEAYDAAVRMGFTVVGTWHHSNGHKIGLEALREIGVAV